MMVASFCSTRWMLRRTARRTMGVASCVGKCLGLVALILAALVALVVLYSGLLLFPEGRSIVIAQACDVGMRTIAVPPSERGVFEKVFNVAFDVVVELPMFIIGFNADRASMFEEILNVCGAVTPFNDGIALSSHKDVKAVLESDTQLRGRFLGAMSVPPECFGEETLIFLSTGELHSKLRSFLLKAVHAFSADSFEAVQIPEYVKALPDGGYEKAHVERVVVRNLFRRMFGAWPSESDLDMMVEYFTYGGTCVLGTTFHKVTMGMMLQHVRDIRSYVKELVGETPGGKHITAQARDEGMDDSQVDAIVTQAVDGFLFAGMFGTTHLTWGALSRLHSNPPLYAQMWEADRRSFLLEQARVDPPVTSVTALLEEDRDITLSIQATKPLHLPRGTTVQLFLSNANRDPAVFGGEAESRTRAKQFDPSRGDDELDQIVSFNGIEGMVKRKKAPRGCLGHDLALSLAEDIVEALKPTQEQIEAFSTLYTEAEEQKLRDKARDALRSAWDEYDFVGFTKTSGEQNIFDLMGFSVWFVCCAGAAVFLRCTGTYTTAKSYYIRYLLGQMTLCIGNIVPRIHLPLFYLGQIVAGAAYGRLFLHVHGFGRYWRALLVVISMLFALGVLAVSQFFGYAFPQGVLQVYCTVFYAPLAVAGLITLFNLWRTRSSATFFVGFIGGMFGIANLLWPLYFDSVFYHLLSRIADSVLYVPLVVFAVADIDSADGTPAKEEDKRKKKKWKGWAGRIAMSSFHIALAIGVVAFAAVAQQSMYGWADGNACPYVDLETADINVKHSCEVATDALGQLDFYTQLFFKILKMQHEGERASNATKSADCIGSPWYHDLLPKKHLHFGVMAPVVDPEDAPIVGTEGAIQAFVEDGMDWFLRQLPMLDIDVQWESLEHAREAMDIVSRMDVPSPTIDWSRLDVNSDEVLSVMAFAGISSHRLVRKGSAAFSQLPTAIQQISDDVGAEFISDFTWMSKLDMRPSFEPYGAAAFFDGEAKLLAIDYPYRNKTLLAGNKSPDEWKHAKWVYRSSAVTGITVRDHLIGIHMMMANFLATANVEALNPMHPIRALLRPFTYRTFKINRGATTYLCESKGLLHRAVGLSFLGLKQAMKYSFTSLRYSSVDGLLKYQGLDGLGSLHSWAQDALEFSDIVRKYVTAYVELYYSDTYDVLMDEEVMKFMQQMHRVPNSNIPQVRSRDDLVDVLSNFIILVTGVHSHVGNVAEYLMDAQFASAKIRYGRDMADVQASYQAMSIALLTGWKVPDLINDFEHLLIQDQQIDATRNLMRTFQRELVALADAIDERNAVRPFPSNSMNPRKMHSSVSI